MNDLHTLEDAAVIRRMKSGDMGGLENLVERYQVRAVRAAYFITYDEALAQDIAQDVFLRLYHSVQRFDEARPFGPYLMQSVVNASLNSMRHSKKKRLAGGQP
ncbi:MAG TPA: RNA polymerase sigma factor [Anaerolineaceae bacterium]|nr:RNA polymerase sigma factor [Anaerolineaceae bacterium]HPN52602.1 RNA polymerase sigma factor [Anaerolineaceae bacterium]